MPSQLLPEKPQMTHRRTRQHRCVHGGVVFILLAGAIGTGCAAQSPALDRVSLSLGGYYGIIDTTIGGSLSNGEFRDHVNLEDDLGFDADKTVPRIRFNLLIGDSQGFSFDYFSVNRSHSQVLEMDFSYDGNNYDATAKVHGKLDFDSGSVAYRWWFGEGNNVFGVGLGGAWYRMQVQFNGSGTVNGIPVDEASADAGTRTWAPVVQLGWRYAFDEKWRMYVDASGIDKNGGDLYGHIYNVDIGLEWYPWKNLGFSAEYGYTRIQLDKRQDDFDNSLDMRLKGPSLFVKLRF